MQARKSILILLFVVGLITLPSGKIHAQLTVTWDTVASSLVNTLIGPGIQVFNPTRNCPGDSASGTFNGTASNIGLNAGTILTSGSIHEAPGPNNSGSAGQNNLVDGDDDLDPLLAPDSTFDACAIEFDFIPLCDSIQIAYVFASEEYDEYVCGTVNDIFAFFISGPGYAVPTNIATVPGTATPVSINTVNNGSVGAFGSNGPGCVLSNSTYYTSNTGGATVQYDGFTNGLVAQASVIPCSTYHVKIVVADGGDGVFDSAVFLEQNGIRCTASLFDIEVEAGPGMIEGCRNDTILFTRSGDTTSARTVSYTVSGTATNGVDYNNLSGSITFPANSPTVTLPLTPTVDGITEGMETLILIVADTFCGGTASDTVVVNIYDNPVVDAGPDRTACAGDSVLIGLPGSLPDTFSWSPVTGLGNPNAAQTNVASPSADTVMYFLTLTDSNGCMATDSMIFRARPVPIAGFSATSPVCVGAAATVTFTGTAGTGATYNWNFQGGTVVSGTGAGPYQVSWSAPGNYMIYLQVTEDSCPSNIDSIQVAVGAPPALTFNNTDPSCAGFTDGATTVNAAGGFLPLTYAWNTSPVQNTAAIGNLSQGTYSVTVTDNAGCSSTDSTTLIDPPVLTGSIYTTNASCSAAVPNGTAVVSAGGGTPSYSYLWNNGQTNSTLLGLSAGIYTCTITDNQGCTIVLTDTVLQEPSPIVTAGPDVSFCEGTGGAQVFATGSGTVSPYYYTWWCDSTNTFCGLDSVFDNDPIASPTQTTTYYVQVVDGNGCESNIDSLIVTVLPKPIVDAGPDLWICGDSAPCQILNPVVTGAPGPYQYQWSPATGLNNDTIPNPCARPDTTTIYTLTVVASNGCSSFTTTVDTNSTVTVHVPPIPVAEAGPDRDLCLGDTLMLQGYGFGAGPLYDFEWSPLTGLSASNIPNPLASPSATTAYILTVWSNNCPSYGDTVIVNVHTNPTADAGPDVEICLGDTAVLTGSAAGDSTATYTYFWTPATGVTGQQDVKNLSAAPVSTTTYYLVATSNYGCDSPADSAVVYLKPTPVAEAGPQQVICWGDTAQLQGSWFTTTTPPVTDPSQVYFAWTPANTVSDSTLVDPLVWPGQSQFYYLEVRYNTCATLDSVLVTQLPELGAQAEADTSVICQQDSVQLFSSGGLGSPTYQWIPDNGLSNPTIQNPIAAPSVSTTYLLILSESGCSDTVEVPIEVLPTPEAAFIHSPETGCMPHEVRFVNASAGGDHYIWQFGDGSQPSNQPNPVHLFENPGTYPVTLTVVSPGGCKDEIMGVIVNVGDTAIAEFTSSPLYPAEMKLPATAVQFIDLSRNAVSWSWEFGDGAVSAEQNPAHTYTDEGMYEVVLQVTTPEGCLSEVSHGPYRVVSPELFIPNVFSPNNDGVNDRFLVRYTGDQHFSMQILDRWGAEIYNTRDKYAGWDGLNEKGENVPEGVYFYIVVTGDRSFTGEISLLR